MRTTDNAGTQQSNAWYNDIKKSQPNAQNARNAQNAQKIQKVYIHLDCETRGPMAGIHQFFQLSMLVVFDESDIVPHSIHPFTPDICPCFVDQKTWSIYYSDIKWDRKTEIFWSDHKQVYEEIMQDCQSPPKVVQEISNFLKEIKSKYLIVGIVMSPSWFDWSHFVHMYNIFSHTVVDCFDVAKLNVICMKSMLTATNHLGIQPLYHPNLKHNHNSKEDVKSAAYKFYWLQRQLSITRMHLNEISQNKQFSSYSDMVKHELKNTGDVNLRWVTPFVHSRPFHHLHPRSQKITLNDYVTKQSFENNNSTSFTWQQQKFVGVKVNNGFSKTNKNKRRIYKVE